MEWNNVFCDICVLSHFNFLQEWISVWCLDNFGKKFFLVFMQKRKNYCLLHIASYHYYPLIKIHLYQGYFNTSYHWHMKMSCLFRFHVDMLIIQKIVNKGVHVSENGKMLLHSTCENNYDGIIMILFIVNSISFFTFPNHFFVPKFMNLYKFISFLAITKMLCESCMCKN
jgi:hypothetical protein